MSVLHSIILKDLLIKTAIVLKCLITFERLILSISFENSCNVSQLVLFCHSGAPYTVKPNKATVPAE